MATIEILSLLQTLSVVLAVVVSISTLRRRGDDKAAVLAKMQADIEYIKARVDRQEDMRERMSTVEQSAKSAHKRLDDHIRNAHKEDS